VLLALVIAGQFALIGYLVYQQQRQAPLIAEVVRCSSPDLVEMVALVDRLCQRLQAPELAAAQHFNEGAPVYAPPAVSMFDDDDFNESKEEMALRLDGDTHVNG
jgi:hypothetical protein